MFKLNLLRSGLAADLIKNSVFSDQNFLEVNLNYYLDKF